jgi:hypothetical protein
MAIAPDTSYDLTVQAFMSVRSNYDITVTMGITKNGIPVQPDLVDTVHLYLISEETHEAVFDTIVTSTSDIYTYSLNIPDGGVYLVSWFVNFKDGNYSQEDTVLLVGYQDDTAYHLQTGILSVVEKDSDFSLSAVVLKQGKPVSPDAIQSATITIMEYETNSIIVGEELPWVDSNYYEYIGNLPNKGNYIVTWDFVLYDGKPYAREVVQVYDPNDLGFVGIPDEIKDFKVGEYGMELEWQLVDQKGYIVRDLAYALYVKLMVGLAGKVNEYLLSVTDAENGKVAWRVPEGAFHSAGIAKMEIVAKYEGERDVTNTFEERIKKRVGIETDTNVIPPID